MPPRAVIVGLARDCAIILRESLSALERIGEDLGGAAFLVLHNDSSDDTHDVLRRWVQAGHERRVLDLPGLATAYPRRTGRLAFLRNVGLFHARNLAKDMGAEFLVMADLDGVNSEIVTGDVFRGALATAPHGWAGLFANSREAYYDIWALREATWCPDDCWAEVQRRPFHWSAARATERLVHQRQVHIAPDEAPIPVSSAFGGFGLYRIAATEGCWYAGTNATGAEVCEHVAFNLAISNAGGPLYILPSLLNCAPARHLKVGISGRNDRPWQQSRESNHEAGLRLAAALPRTR